MRKLAAGAALAVVLLGGAAMPGTAFAHNEGHVTNGQGVCVDVGGGNAPPEGNAFGNDGHARGVHHAIHAGQSAVESGACAP